MPHAQPTSTPPAARMSDVRWERVRELRAAIQRGGYRVPTAVLAEKLVRTVRREAGLRP